METYKDGVALCPVENREQWHQWLKENHHKAKSVWLVYYKPGSGKTRVSYDDAVDEAICFGWIDSKPNSLDENRSIQFFAPRNPKSNWSKINKQRVERLLADGRMEAAGLQTVSVAKASGSWDALNDVEEMMIPDDLKHALSSVPEAMKHFTAFPRSSKKNILEWLHNAKQPDTRQKRVQETAKLAAQNIRANHYRQPKNR
ncbi:YdeI/OmpD-associated family protein [Mucilaginibacter paludis]|uniref:Bacteriocin-protection protein, YdeI/OmpD-associated family n=1 Tax=Mucilaginibacter paludis DSM 18603 TaxID=714943 RepID=H1Y9B8_9SPHI|nr:YdeI/OmpD-associated family protein [Mucilaginibacter paludis]EHQ29496.1 hypothetical protein Mucpa_5424 [Mucilaginibacter paludis DSM 18603]